jgi:tRNA threonylcarbamoyladenosine biosynthesis protein TsaE
VTGTHLTHSDEDTQAVAHHLAAQLVPADVVLLSGTLGAGKTTFVRGLAAGLGIDPDEVTSPTFTLVHEYRGGRLNLYRLDKAATAELGLEELGVSDGVLAIEWPERLAHPLPRALHVDIDIVDETTRRITIGPRAEAYSIR